MMKEMSIEEYKKVELGILRYFDSYCSRNKLRYLLAGGTLLGAIRHGGFIPWDDDIDIVMPRSDYMTFVRSFNKENNRYQVLSPFTIDGWYSTFAEIEDCKTVKIYENFDKRILSGVSIDVFPIDGAPENYLVRRIYWGIQNFLARIFILSQMRFSASKRYCLKCNAKKFLIKNKIRTAIKLILMPFAKCTIPLRLSVIVNKIGMIFDVDNCSYVGVSVFPLYGYKECMKSELLLQSIKWNFCNMQLNIPVGYEEYLKQHYGAYMQCPSDDQQVSHHHFKAFWK